MALVLFGANCADLSIKGGRIELRKFPDGEAYVRIPVDFYGKHIALVHRCYPNPNETLVQLFLILSEISAKAKSVRAIVPYLPYARQDKRFLIWEALSAETICKLIKKSGCGELITFDCHFLKSKGVFNYAGLKITNLSLAGGIIKAARKMCNNPLVITPDEGARYMTGGKGGFFSKERGKYSEGGAYRKIAKFKARFDAEGRDIIIVDDIVSTGSTMIKAVEACKAMGAGKIVCGVVHGLFLFGSLRRLRQAGATVISSNTIPNNAARVKFEPMLGDFI